MTLDRRLWFVFLAAPSSLHATEPETRNVPAVCGSIAAIRERYVHELTKAVRPGWRAADQDLHDIAILEDDGTLVIGAGRTQSQAIAARFYATHGDDFDFLAIFVASTFATNIEPESGFAFEQNVANDVDGLNLPVFNHGGAIAPGVTRLRSLLNMNDLGEYCEDPSEKLPAFLDTFSGVSVMGQEAGHMVGSFVTANNADILGRGDAHWSYFFETYGSALEGNGWRDNGDGTFTTISSGDGFSQLDNYLWGLLLPAQVTDPMYVLGTPMPLLGNGDTSLPAEGVTLTGTPVNVTLDDIIAVHGARVPSAATSQKSFAMAWILVIPQGTSVAPHDLEKIDDFRNQWQEEFFPAETDGIGTMTSQLGPAPVTADFESRVIAGAPGLTVGFDNDSFGHATSFLWDFGDGTLSTERHPIHTYNAVGAYDVSLTVHGTNGPATITKPAFIRVGSVTTWFADDFETDHGWARPPTDTATTGLWLCADPNPTAVTAIYGNDTVAAPVQPGDDHTPSGTQCLITGNDDTSLGSDDVDGGRTTIVSPRIDLSGAINPVLSFWHWFSNNSGAAPGMDSLVVSISHDDGLQWARVRAFPSSHHFWREEQIGLAGLVPLTDSMRLRFRCGDEGPGSVVEAAVDDVTIFEVDDAVDVGPGPRRDRELAVDVGANPFRQDTVLRLTIPSPGGHVRLDVFGADGRHVRTLLRGTVAAGPHAVTWDGRDTSGRTVPSGTYFCRLQARHASVTRKVVRIN